MDITYNQVDKEQKYLEGVRKDYETMKRLCTDLSYPERVESWEWCQGAYGHKEKGKKSQAIVKRVHGAEAIAAFDIWSNGIMGQFFPKEINWFKEAFPDKYLKDSKAVIQWLQDTDEHMISVINNSGGLGTNADYYTQKRWILKDCGCIGDSYMYIDEAEAEAENNNKLLFNAMHPSQFWKRHDVWGRLEVLHHKQTYRMDNFIREFGKEALSDEQRENLRIQKDYIYSTCDVIRGVYRNFDYEPESAGNTFRRWQMVYINVDGKKKISQEGSDTLNPVPHSIRRPSNWSYGQGIVYGALLEILTADEIAKTMLQATQQAVRPSMLITSALMHKLDLRPGAVTKVSNREMNGLKMGDLVSRLVDSSSYPFGADQQEKWRNIVNQRFGVPLFVALTGVQSGERTAFEVNQVKAEQAVLLGPVISEIANMTDMEFDRIYQIELESGRAPDIPPEVLESSTRNTDLIYTGPLFQLLNQYYQSNSLFNTIGAIQQVLAIMPDAGAVIDGDNLMRKVVRSTNSPEELILDHNDVMELRAIAAQQQATKDEVEMLSKAAPALGKQIEENSILGQLQAA